MLIIQILKSFKSGIIQFAEEWWFRFKVMSRGGLCSSSKSFTGIKNIRVGRNVVIHKGYRISIFQQFYNQHLFPYFEIGDNCNFGFDFTALVADKLIIGKNSIFAGNVTLVTENHGIDPKSESPYHSQPLKTGPITIGSGCWFGQNVIVLPNVIIGNKVIVGANAVVTQDIPSYSIAVGNPAKVIKRFNNEIGKWENV